MDSPHFKQKDPLSHVIEKRKEGVLQLSESHGTELPGHLAAGADSWRETSIFFLLLGIFLLHFKASFSLAFSSFCALSIAWLIWKTGRSAWLGWFRLERLHRVIEQERFEIEHHRPQEREELEALYAAKGFEGDLLEQVVSTLMADQDRLLKVMLEEEMGLTLSAYEHPLKQALGALLGVLCVSLVCITAFLFFSYTGLFISSFLLLLIGAAFSAYMADNAWLNSTVWNGAIGILAGGSLFFLLKILLPL